jgi:peroxiredoxin
MNSQTRILLIVGIVSIGIGFMVYQATRNPELTQQGPDSDDDVVVSKKTVSNMVGKQRPDFSLPDLNGVQRGISEWDGNVLVINFWASWCLPCLDEIPELVTLQSLYEAKGFQVIGIALQNPDGLDEFVNQQGMDYPILAGEAAVIAIAEKYGNLIGALPYTAIVDRLGTVVYTKAGAVTRGEVEAIIEGLL